MPLVARQKGMNLTELPVVAGAALVLRGGVLELLTDQRGSYQVKLGFTLLARREGSERVRRSRFRGERRAPVVRSDESEFRRIAQRAPDR